MEFPNQIIMVNLESSKYFADAIYDELTDQGVHISRMGIKRSQYPNGEKYYKLEIPNAFSLLGKTALYVGSIVSDEDIFDVQRIGYTLAYSGIKRRIFVIPFLAYSSNDRAISPGEVVVSKINHTLFSSLGATDEGNVFVFLDLHTAGLLHYFEGSCLRIELYGQRALCDAIYSAGFDMSKVVIGAPNLRDSKWVNSYASEFKVPIAFVTQNSTLEENSPGSLVIGDVQGKHVIVYSDLIRSSSAVINVTKTYLNAGASSVDFMLSHFAIVDENQIKEIADSPVSGIYATNSHPITQTELVRSSSKFHIIDIAPYFARCLFEMLPSDRFPRLSV